MTNEIKLKGGDKTLFVIEKQVGNLWVPKEEGFVFEGTVRVGEVLFVGNVMDDRAYRTSLVQEILNTEPFTVFRTLNSVYRLRPSLS